MSTPSLLARLRQLPADPALPDTLLQTRQWEGPLCRVRLDNTGRQSEAVHHWRLFEPTFRT